MSTFYGYVIVGLLCTIGGFILGYVVFGDSGQVVTTDEWNAQVRDQRKTRRDPR
jgi:hypothetical protein